MPSKTFDSQIGGTTASLEICAILIQSENASCPIPHNPLPKVRIFRLRQPEYLQPIITQYFIDNKSEIWLLFLIAHSKR